MSVKRIACAGRCEKLRQRWSAWCREDFLPKLILRFYFAEESPALKKSIAELRRILKDNFGSDYELTLVDVLKNPQMAEKDKILATPTLLRLLPPPARKIIGDLTNKEKVLIALELNDFKKG